MTEKGKSQSKPRIPWSEPLRPCKGVNPQTPCHKMIPNKRGVYRCLECHMLHQQALAEAQPRIQIHLPQDDSDDDV